MTSTAAASIRTGQVDTTRARDHRQTIGLSLSSAAPRTRAIDRVFGASWSRACLVRPPSAPYIYVCTYRARSRWTWLVRVVAPPVVVARRVRMVRWCKDAPLWDRRLVSGFPDCWKIDDGMVGYGEVHADRTSTIRTSYLGGTCSFFCLVLSLGSDSGFGGGGLPADGSSVGRWSSRMGFSGVEDGILCVLFSLPRDVAPFVVSRGRGGARIAGILVDVIVCTTIQCVFLFCFLWCWRNEVAYDGTGKVGELLLCSFTCPTLPCPTLHGPFFPRSDSTSRGVKCTRHHCAELCTIAIIHQSMRPEWEEYVASCSAAAFPADVPYVSYPSTYGTCCSHDLPPCLCNAGLILHWEDTNCTIPVVYVYAGCLDSLLCSALALPCLTLGAAPELQTKLVRMKVPSPRWSYPFGYPCRLDSLLAAVRFCGVYGLCMYVCMY